MHDKGQIIKPGMIECCDEGYVCAINLNEDGQKKETEGNILIF